MESETPKLSRSTMCRLGRQHLDGASFDWLAEHNGTPIEQIRQAWEFCREQLSRHLSDDDDSQLTDEEIHQESEACLRLLLHWQESLELAQRIASPEFDDRTTSSIPEK